MYELKRIFFNKIWILFFIALSLLNLFVYFKYQVQQLNGHPDFYIEYTDLWANILTNRKEDQAITLIDKRLQFLYDDGYLTNEEMSETNALNQWKTRLKYGETYLDNIHRISYQSDMLMSNPLFSQKNTFEYRNAQKTKEDFLSIKNNYTGIYLTDIISSIVEYEGAIFFYILQLLVTIIILLHPLRLGLESLIRTTSHGRVQITAVRIFSIGICSIFCVFFSVFGQLFLGSLIYKQPLDLLIPIQSVPHFQNFTENVTVAEFLVWFIIFRILSCFVLGLLLWEILSHFRSNVVGIITITLLLVIEWILFQQYKINDTGYWLSAYNIMHLLFLQPIIRRYLNYNILGYPVNERIVLFCFLLIISSLLVLYALFKSIRQEGNSININKRHSIFKKSFRESFNKSLYMLELKKTFIYGKGMLIVLIGVLALCCCRTPRLNYNQKEELLLLYIQNNAGPINTETYDKIIDNRKVAQQEYNNIIAEENTAHFIDYYEAKLWAYNELKIHYEQLMDFKNTGLNNISLVDESPFIVIYGQEGSSFRQYESCIIIFILISIIPLFISQENSTNIKNLIFSSPNGRSTLWVAKIFLVIVFIIILWVIWIAYELILFFNIDQGSELMLSNIICLKSMFYLNTGYTVIQYIIMYYLQRLFLMFLLGTFVFALSSYPFAYLSIVGSCAVLLLVPYFLTKVGMLWLKPFSSIEWLISLENVSLTYTITIMFVCAISSSCFLYISHKLWKEVTR